MAQENGIRYRFTEEDGWNIEDGKYIFFVVPDKQLQEELMGGTFKHPIIICPVSYRITEVEVEYDPISRQFKVLSFSVAHAIDDEPIETPWYGDLETTPITFNDAELEWFCQTLPLIMKRAEENEARGWPEPIEREEDYLR